MFLPIPAENQPGLIADLEGDPFVGHALSNATCELYHRNGMFLAPLTTALTTIKHCQFGHRSPAVINDGNQADGREPAETAEPAHVETKKKSEGSEKGGGRACRGCRPAKATARTASDSQGIITSSCQRSAAQLTTTARLLLQRKRSAQTNIQNLTGSHGS